MSLAKFVTQSTRKRIPRTAADCRAASSGSPLRVRPTVRSLGGVSSGLRLADFFLIFKRVLSLSHNNAVSRVFTAVKRCRREFWNWGTVLNYVPRVSCFRRDQAAMQIRGIWRKTSPLSIYSREAPRLKKRRGRSR
jgi:hypothetical protein